MVPSQKTICSFPEATLPHDLASLSVELEQAPSLTSATVICTAYLCIGTSFPKYLRANNDVLYEVFGHAAAYDQKAGLAVFDLYSGQFPEIFDAVYGHMAIGVFQSGASQGRNRRWNRKKRDKIQALYSRRRTEPANSSS